MVALIQSCTFQLKCCGYHGYADWYNPPISMPVPKSCCKVPNCDTQDEANIYTEVNMISVAETETLWANVSNVSSYRIPIPLQGCYESVVEIINENLSTIGAASIGVAIFPLIGIILACTLAININKNKYEQMS